MSDLFFQVVSPLYAGDFGISALVGGIIAAVSAGATTTASVVQTNAQKKAARTQREVEYAGQNKQLVKADIEKRKAEQQKAALSNQKAQNTGNKNSGLGGQGTLLGGGSGQDTFA